MRIYDFQQYKRIGRFEVYCLKTGTVQWDWYGTTDPGVRDWGEVPPEVIERVEAYVQSRRPAWIWAVEIDGWEFEGQDREEKRIMEEIRENYDLLAPLSMERKRKLWYHGIRALVENKPMPTVWKELQERRAKPSDAIRARIAGLEERLEMLRAN